MIRKMLSGFLERYKEWTYFPLAKRIILRRIVEVAGMLQGRLLDVGAGDRPYEKLFGNATDYIGSNSRTYYTADEIRELEPYTDLWIDDAIKLPCDDASFDSILLLQVLSDISDPPAFFAEARINYYSERLRQVQGLRRWPRYRGLVVCLCLLPVFSLVGMLVYLCECNSRDQFWCTFNQIILCESPRHTDPI